ncbi:hypothetical protein LCGC14_3121860 [marine sediment metagenome]|uniref:Uncharacterized protein n=1 Tax=marine sediment metagenome TaxID=412755 RepID=A0A0F8Y9H4_9ZZZZ
MGTLATIITRARIKGRDVDKNLYTNDELIHLVNGVLHEVYDELKGVESNMVYAEDTQATVDGTMEYTPSFNFEGIMPDGVWLDGQESYLSQGSEADKVKYDYENQTGAPEGYYLTEDGKIGFLPVPNAILTVHIQFWKPLTELTDYDDDDLPWFGLWNQFIEDRLVSEMLAIQERDITWRAAILNGSYNRCMGKTFSRGVRPRKFVSDFFSVDGI